jgi:hypothetical protein
LGLGRDREEDGKERNQRDQTAASHREKNIRGRPGC